MKSRGIRLRNLTMKISRSLALHVVVGLMLTVFFWGQASYSQNATSVPPPAGFLEGSALSGTLKAMGLAGQPASVKLVGVYYPPDVLADILNNGYSTPSPFCKAVFKHEYRSVSEAEKEFRKLVKNLKKDMVAPLDLDDPAVKRILKHYEDASRNIVPDVGVKMIGASLLGIVLEKDTAFAYSSLINIGWSDGQSQANMPFATSDGFLLLGIRQLELSVAYPFKDAASIKAANQKLYEWISAIEKANGR